MRKIALCIGNNNYPTNPLNYAVNDATAMCEKLTNLGFSCCFKHDLCRTDMVEAIDEFTDIDSMRNADVALIYYAGHGCEIEGKNVFIPVDVDFNSRPSILRDNSFDLSSMIDALGHYPDVRKIIIIDACRNVLDGTRSTGFGGFSPISAPENTYIAFSTSSGERSYEDDETQHGFYTSVLLDWIAKPRIHIESMFKQVRIDLIKKREGLSPQIPWEHSSLVADIFFNNESIYNGPEYDKHAYKDHEFNSYASTEIQQIIEDLRSYIYDNQNRAANRIIQIDFENLNCLNDLFVIGRNICQACERQTNGFHSWDCDRFVRSFERLQINNEAKKHILNGIAYEIYFDHENQLRTKFKTSLLDKVIELLDMKEFEACKDFILSKLCKFEDNLIYLPGQNSVIALDVKISEFGNGYMIESVSNNGKYVFKAEHPDADGNSPEFDSCRAISLKTYLANRIAAPSNYLEIRCDGIDLTNKISEIVWIFGKPIFNRFIS